MIRVALALACLVGCHAARHPTTPKARAHGNDLTLYRDWALIRQRVELDVTGPSMVAKVSIAAGVTDDQLVVLDRGGLTISSLVMPAPLSDARLGDKPLEITLDVTAPKPGHYAIELAYVTDRVDWDAAYTMTANEARDRAIVRGALAIYNHTGITLRATSARLIDSELGAWRGKRSEQVAALLVGATQASTPPVAPRELGPLVLGNGETRVELLAPMPRPMSAVLVYDPVGTKHDHAGATPVTDDTIGVEAKASPRVTENFEVVRDKAASEGLPAGPVRLLEQRPDGSLVVLGEARLFDAASRVAEVDTIAVGTAEGVTGNRERRELTVNEDDKRLVEEFVLTIANERAYPVRVLLREHLYRGQNWALAYPYADPDASKEGPQQIAIRRRVPARSNINVHYVVVYTWGQ